MTTHSRSCGYACGAPDAFVRGCAKRNVEYRKPLRRLVMSTPFFNQVHRRLTDPCVTRRPRPVKLLAPRQRRDITILVHGFVRDESQSLPQRRPGIRVGAMIKQQSRKRGVLLTSTQIRLRHDTSE